MEQLLLIILGNFISIQFFGWLIVGVTYLRSKKNGYTMISITDLNLRWYRDFYDKNRPGCIKFSFGRLNDIFPRMAIVKKPMPTNEELRKIAKKEFIIFLILTFVGVFAIEEMVYFLPDNPKLVGLYNGLVGGTCVVFLVYAVLSFIIMRKPTGLREYIAMISDASRTRESMEAFELPDFAHVEFDSSNKLSDKINYLLTYYRVAEVKNNMVAMSKAAHAYEQLSATVMLTDQGHFSMDSNLFEYYSFREYNPELANKYYQHSKKRIDADKDCNGRRKLAYYSFYVLHDYETARKYAEEGLASLEMDDPGRSDVMSDFEKKMLTYLKEQIEMQKQGSTQAQIQGAAQVQEQDAARLEEQGSTQAQIQDGSQQE